MLNSAMLRIAALVIALTLSVSANAMADSPKPVNVPAGDLTTALELLEKQSGVEIVYRPELLKGVHTSGVKGTLSSEDAVTRLLQGTKLKWHSDRTGVLLITEIGADGSAVVMPGEKVPAKRQDQHSSGEGIQVAQLDQASAGPQAVVSSDDQNAEKKRKEEGLSEIVVTGTHIRNVEPLSPVITLTHDDMVTQGYTRLDQAIAQLPQSFSGAVAQDSNAITGAGASAANNYSFGSGVNLRGIGPGATLVLLNGERLPLTALGQSVDISQIPLSIIDRVEVLTDGASATYGSDAIAGVVNIITKKGYSGFDTALRSTGIADGKAPNYGGSTTGGVDWGQGNVIGSLDYEKDSPLFASARSFTATVPGPTSLFPKQETASGYIAVNQTLSDRVSLSSDVLYSQRRFDASDGLFDTIESGYAKQLDVLVKLNYLVYADWQATFVGQLPKEIDTLSELIAGGALTENSEYSYSTPSVEARLDGTLVQIPGGSVRAALGASYRQERFEQNVEAATNTGISLLSQIGTSQRHVTSAYLEFLVPVVGEQNSVPLVRSLSIDLAGRYDSYSDFGSTTNPKLTIQWRLFDDLTVHGSYAKSFRAPTLYEVSPGGSVGYVWPAPNPASPSGTTTALVIDGTNPSLTAERAESFALGLTYTPQFARGLKVDVSAYDINYRQKIDRLSVDGFSNDSVIENAGLLGSLINLNPTSAEIGQALNVPGRPIYNYVGACGGNLVGTPGCAVDPSSISAIANIGYVNVGSSRLRGLDSSVAYSWDTRIGSLSIDGSGSYFLKYDDQITPTSPTFRAVGQIYQPVRFRGKSNFGWHENEWSANARLNYSSAYNNSTDLSCSLSGCPVSSWTTMDLSASYAASPTSTTSALRGVRISLGISNVFDRRPPFIRDPYGNGFFYDPNNANPLGRAVAISIAKHW